MADVKIDIAAEFTGKKAFKQAETAGQRLEKSIARLAKQYLAFFSTQKLYAFGKASVKAFAADEKAARSLSLALANTGNAFASIEVEKFIADLQRTTGVLDDNLRPAFRTLLTATGDVKKSQDGLALALDIAAGTGKDLSAVSMALAKAYGGQTTALSRLGAGLSKATLASGDMNVITQALTDKFKGQALAAAQGYSGQMDRLTVASQNAKEIIGKDLLDAMQLIAGKDGIGGASTAMESFATQIGNAIYGIGVLTTKIKSLPGADFVSSLLSAAGQVSGLNLLSKYGASKKPSAGQASPGSAGGRLAAALSSKELKTQEKITVATKAQLANVKKITAEKLKQKALDLASIVANQAGGLFDIDKIELAAAAMGKLTAEDKVRVRLKQEIMALEEAIAAGNLEGAAALGNAISQDAKLLGILRGNMTGLSDVKNPFTEWLATLNQMVLALQAAAALASMNPTKPNWQPFNPGPGGYEGIGSGTSNTGSGNYGGLAGAGQYGGGGAPVINVNVAGSVTTERDLVSAITKGIYNNQASGTPVGYSTQY